MLALDIRQHQRPRDAVEHIGRRCVYRLALEQGASAKRYHAIAEEGVPFKMIASDRQEARRARGLEIH